MILRVPVLDDNGLAVNPAQLAQALKQSWQSGSAHTWRPCCEKAEAGQFAGLPRANRERPTGDRSAKQCDELAPPHGHCSAPLSVPIDPPALRVGLIGAPPRGLH
jgi:hypothetical protein